MKLYTEEQVREVINLSRDVYKEGHPLTIEEILKQLTPIELPSDEQIDEYASKYSADGAIILGAKILGAKFIKEQILNQKK